MAEQTKKSKYNFGGHELDAKLYLQNIRDNAETFLNSKTDWTPEQKEEWKHAYTNFTNALQEDINNGGGRFSTDEFGTITDTKGEFSNTDSDNYYYNNKGQQISQEDYDTLKKRKQGKYQTFEANRQFASYANQIGKGLREALAAKNKTSDDTNGFDYAKNGFDAYWQKKYNPAGTANDLQPYWNKDKEGEYTNRVAETIADLDDYMSKQEMNDDVKAAYNNYRNILGQYNPSDKNFNLDTWKNNMILAASRAGISGWNNGYFNIGSQSTTPTEDKKPEAFDINNDQAVIDKYKLADQITAHPEQREHLLDLARRQYNQESQNMTDEYNAAIKKQQEVAHNKIWEQYLLNNPYVGDVNKRVGRAGTTSFWSGAKSTKKAQDYVSQTIMSQEEQDKVHNNIGYVGKLRPEVQAALTSAHWNTDENPLLKQLNVSTTKGLNLKNLGNWYQYNWDQLMARRDTSMKGWTPVKDNKGNEVWKRNDSLRGSDGTYFYMFMGRDGKLHTYRSKPYSKLKAEAIAKGQLGMSIYTKQGAENAKKQQQAKAAVSKQTAQDKGRTAQQQKNMEQTGFTGTDIARLASIGMDMGSLAAAYTGPETMGVGTLVSAGLGVGSTATNLVADLVDGENTWEALKTAGYGLGMDTLGLIPGAGTAGKLGKIGKTAIKYVPRILAYLGTLQGVQNMPYIVNSFKKLGTNQKLTVDDYRNMAQGISLITGIGAAGGRKIRNNKTTQQLGKQKVDFSKLKNKSIQVKQSNQVALRFKDKQGNTKSFVFKGDDANAIKNAKNNEEIKAITSKYSKLRNYELVSSKALRPHLQWIRKDGNWQNPLHRVNNPIRKYDVYENAGGMYTNQQGMRGWFMPYGGDKISKSNILGVPRKTKQVKADTDIIKQQVQNAVKERAANENLLKDFQAASDMRRQAKNSGNIKDYHDATTLQKEAWNKLQGARTEYNKLRSMVKKGSITFGNGQNKVQADWRDILAKYRIAYKQGGSIQKLASGNSINGNPYGVLQAFGTYDPSNYVSTYGGEQKGMQINGTYGAPYVSQGVGIGQGRIKTDKNYSTFTNESREKAKNIENQQLYKNYTDALIKGATDYLNTPEAERTIKWNKDNNEFLYWSEQFDNQFKEGDKGRFFSSPGVLNTSWKTTNNDSYNNPAGQQNDVISRIKAVRNDQQLARAHNDREKEGKRYFWEENGVKNWVDAANIDKLDKNKFSITLFGDSYGDDGTHWNDYKITANSQVNPAEDNKPKQSNNFSLKDVINKMDVTDKWGIPRAMYADITNRKVTDMLKKQPLLLDPQEDHRYIQSDLDAEMNGQQAAAQLARTASHPITSDGNLQSMLQLEAAAKGNEAITAGRQQSNQRLREMQEQAWQQEVANHTNRHNIAMQNRQSIYNTANENKALEAAYLNQKFTVWDALAQEKEFKEKSDYEQMRARADQFAQGDINNAIKYGLSNYADKYGLTPEDVSLWNKVYTDGTVKLSDIQKDPIKLRQWNKVLSATRQIQQDLLGEYYGIPKSKYWTIRQSTPSYSYSTEVKKAKKGTKLNLRKVREAAKGEKLAAAQLKAQTADADRFYKTTKDHIDRMYAAINRLTNYSSTKKKRKKKKNYDI